MYRLILDSSTKLMWIGLAKDNKLIANYTRVARKDHAKYLVDAIDNLLKVNDVTIDDIKEIVVSSGPGSYTGLRVAGMVAKMLAYTKNIPLYEISSIYFLSSGYDKKVAGLIDARRNQYFFGIYENTKTVFEDTLMLYDDIINLPEIKNSQIVILNEDNYLIDITKVFKKMSLVKDVHSFVPKYLRKTEAERNLWFIDKQPPLILKH